MPFREAMDTSNKRHWQCVRCNVDANKYGLKRFADALFCVHCFAITAEQLLEWRFKSLRNRNTAR